MVSQPATRNSDLLHGEVAVAGQARGRLGWPPHVVPFSSVVSDGTLSQPHEMLVEHIKHNALQVGDEFVLRSGAVSSWYVDARMTTFDGLGARLVGKVVLEMLDPTSVGVGGMTIGADPIAVATAITAANAGRSLRAFSIRKEPKHHGVGGRMVGPIAPGDRVTLLEDTTTTGGAFFEAMDVAVAFGLDIVQALALVDRSDGAVAAQMDDRGVAYQVVIPTELLDGP